MQLKEGLNCFCKQTHVYPPKPITFVIPLTFYIVVNFHEYSLFIFYLQHIYFLFENNDFPFHDHIEWYLNQPNMFM